MEQSDQLLSRLKRYAVSVIHLYTTLPRNQVGRVISNQIIRSATSPGAQYCEARRSKSDRDFISKIEGALQEIDETSYWLSLLIEAGVVQPERIAAIVTETDELTRIFVAIARNTKARVKG
jgi:four helix bundle protein